MRWLTLVLKAALFVLLLGFALRNGDPVAVRYYLGYEWQAPLVFVLLAFFAAGAALGLVAALGVVLRQRRELGALRRAAGGAAPPGGAATAARE